jgi:hypothetical protein
MLQMAVDTPGKEKRPACAEALEYQRENQPPAAPSWTEAECLRNEAVAVPKRAQAPSNAPSEAGEQ